MTWSEPVTSKAYDVVLPRISSVLRPERISPSHGSCTSRIEAPRGTFGWATTGTFGFFRPSSGSGAKREFGFFGGRAAASSFFAGRDELTALSGARSALAAALPAGFAGAEEEEEARAGADEEDAERVRMAAARRFARRRRFVACLEVLWGRRRRELTSAAPRDKIDG